MFLKSTASISTRTARFFCRCPDEAPTDPEQEYTTGLSIIAQALKFASDNSGKKLLVAAHAESIGSEGATVSLTDRRAHNVLTYLKGDQEGWAEACQQHCIDDVQNILRWAAKRQGYGCDPGKIDGQNGPKYRKALNAFRQGYKEEFDTEIAGRLQVKGPIDTNDWQAFFELYDIALAEKLEAFDATGKGLQKGTR